MRVILASNPTPEQVGAEISALPLLQLTGNEIRQQNISTKGPLARRIDHLAIRQHYDVIAEVCTNHEQEVGLTDPIGHKVAESHYTITGSICTDHFDPGQGYPMLLPGHELLEACLDPGICLLRLLPSCRQLIPTLNKPLVFDPKLIVLPGQPIRVWCWLKEISATPHGEIQGRGQSVAYVGAKIAGTLDFGFILLSLEQLRQYQLASELFYQRYLRRATV